MRTIEETISGNYSIYAAGKYFRVLSAAGALDINFHSRGSVKESALAVGAGFWSRFDEPFDRVDIAGNGLIKIAVSEVEGGYDAFSILGAVATYPAQSGTVGDSSAVVGTAVTLIAAANPNRRALRLLNAGTSAVTIGGAGVALAGAVVIQPGQLWIEAEAAAAAWYGISAVAGQTIRFQEVLP